MTEPISEVEQIAQLQQQVQELGQNIRQAEVDCAYWKGRCEEAEKLVPALKPPEAAVAPSEIAPAAVSAPVPTPNLDKLLPILQPLLPLLTNPDILKLILPLLKNLSAPRPPADG